MQQRSVAAGERGEVAVLAGHLFDLLQRPEVPKWIRGAAHELCRDFHADMVECTPEVVQAVAEGKVKMEKPEFNVRLYQPA